ncbi:hypothetical protein IE077_002114 [Cardiosporidium cionae]|uniref:BD-FAE-like domain-containing protein n=1 Tax=Cardiosporidium cionae TaxID=476202 RepID=A0ABQ7JBI6_9APIC|nr:hypothetical protein IE077_002114 [Cardiosporidium cionae]|eukprot:KAF8821367.1 hypothetical protein IE077_002114 [Cardiosporidium cionae]
MLAQDTDDNVISLQYGKYPETNFLKLILPSSYHIQTAMLHDESIAFQNRTLDAQKTNNALPDAGRVHGGIIASSLDSLGKLSERETGESKYLSHDKNHSVSDISLLDFTGSDSSELAILPSANALNFPANVLDRMPDVFDYARGVKTTESETKSSDLGNFPYNTQSLYPLVIFLHGGFWKNQWTIKNSFDISFLRKLADQCGVFVAAIEYRRRDDEPGIWSQSVSDILDATRLLENLALRNVLPIDATKVFLIGHSAGGHLALLCGEMLAFLCNTSKINPGLKLAREFLAQQAAFHYIKPVLVIGIAPVTDLIKGYEGKLGDAESGVHACEGYMKSSPYDSEYAMNEYKMASPCSYLPNLVPQIIVGGMQDLDIPLWMLQEYKHIADSTRGSSVSMKILPDADHFDLINGSNMRCYDAVENEIKRIVSSLAA